MSLVSKNVSIRSRDPSKGVSVRLPLVKSCETKTKMGD